MKKALAILWTVSLGCNILSAAVGNEPTWLLVFCPLVCLVMDKWEHVRDDR